MKQLFIIDTKARRAFFSHDGKMIVSSSEYDGGSFVWNAKDGKKLCKIGNEKYYYACFSLDDRKIVSATANDDRVIRIWDFPSLQELIEETRKRFNGNPLSLEERRKYYLE